MDKDFYLKRCKKLVVVEGRTGESLGLDRRGRKLEEGKIRDKDQYRKNRVKGLVERRDKGLEGHISHGIGKKEICICCRERRLV